MKRFIPALFYLTLTVCLTGAVCVSATAQERSRAIFTVVEQPPEFPGGKAALSRYLAENIQVPGALKLENYGTEPIAAKFIIDELGYVHDVRLTTKPLTRKMRRPMQVFMTNIISAVEKMPRWEPGRQSGQRVAVFYTLPIEINLQ